MALVLPMIGIIVCVIAFVCGVYFSTIAVALLSITSFVATWIIFRSIPDEGLTIFMKISGWIVVCASNLVMWITTYNVQDKKWLSDFIKTYVLR
jgi:hypothetical protein